jgi:hypothetical protein
VEPKPATAMTDHELVEYADEHLLYEIEMMRQSWDAPRTGGRSGADWAIDQALLEASALHGRVLIEFLYPSKNPREDDVVAHYYVSDADWNEIRPPMTPRMSTHRERASREVAHLTTGRIGGTPKHKDWTIEGLQDVERALRVFARRASATRLSARLRELILTPRGPASRSLLDPGAPPPASNYGAARGPGTVTPQIGWPEARDR